MVRRQRCLSFILVGAILLLVLLLTFSRAAYIALAFQALLLFFWVLADYRRGSLKAQEEVPDSGVELRKKALYLTSGVLAAILVLLAFTGFYGSLTARLSSIWNAADYSLQGRLTFWSVAWSMFTQFPLFGVGCGNFGAHYTYLQPSWHYFATDAHGIVFKVMSEAGVWGLAFGAGLVAQYTVKLRAASALLRPGNLWPQRLMLTALAGFLAHALVDFDFTYLANVVFFAVLAAVSLGAVLSVEAGDKATSPGRIWRIAVPLAMTAVSLMGMLYVSERRGKEQDNLAKRLAAQLFGRFPVIYAWSWRYQAVAVRWRGQLAEISKQLSSHHLLPEMNHNELAGWQHPADVLSQAVVILLRDDREPQRIERRMDLTAGSLASRAGRVTEVRADGRSLLARLFSLIYLGDFVSYYLAALNGVDPTPIESIEQLKSRLAGEQT